MLNVLHMPKNAENEFCGRLLRSENGGAPSPAIAFSPRSLLGFHLFLPRSLGVLSANLVLSADGVGEILTLPFSWGKTACGLDGYNALLDLSALAKKASFFTYRIIVESAYGRLYASKKEGEAIGFSRTPPDEKESFCIYLCEPSYAFPAHLLGGAVYVTEAFSEHTGAAILEEKDFFARLFRLGANAVWLTADKKEDSTPWRASRVLTPASRRAAQENGIAIYPDFWLAAGLFGNIGYFFEESADRTPAAETGEPMLESCGAIPIAAPSYGERRPCCDHFCGQNGTVAEWLRAGAEGFFVRAADGVGDAFLSTVREKIEEEGGHALFGVLHAHRPGEIAFGVRRRFFFGSEFEGCITPALRHALLAYLTEGKGDALRKIFTEELFTLPARILDASLNALSLPGKHFYDALPENDDREPLAMLAYLIAATLPGCPLIFAGDEWGSGEANTENAMYAFYQRVARLRQKEAVYRDGVCRLLHLASDALVFSREREGEALLTVINRSDTPLFLMGDFTVLFGGRGRKTQFVLPPFFGAVCRVSVWSGEKESLRLSRTQPSAVTSPNVPEKSEILHFATHGVF